jgi:hypothetical protein
MIYKKNNTYFEYIRGKDNASVGTFHKLDSNMQRIKSLTKNGLQLLCADGSIRYETRIIHWNTIEKIK